MFKRSFFVWDQTQNYLGDSEPLVQTKKMELAVYKYAKLALIESNILGTTQHKTWKLKELCDHIKLLVISNANLTMGTDWKSKQNIFQAQEQY